MVVLLLFGGRRIPEAGRWLGTGIRNFFDGLRGIHEDETPPPAKLEGQAKLEAPKETAGSAESKSD
jgi:sec-independent protein translocase protein TatA